MNADRGLGTSIREALASIAAMLRARAIIVAITLAVASTGVAGCGGGESEDEKIPLDDAQDLLTRIQEIQSNIDIGSCLVAANKAEELVADVQALPSSVNSDLRQALENGSDQLTILLRDPDQCQPRTETTTTTESIPTEETTTEETTTQRTQTQPTTTQQTTTQQTTTTPNGGSGGVGPGGL
jgi:hypothetical protein